MIVTVDCERGFDYDNGLETKAYGFAKQTVTATDAATCIPDSAGKVDANEKFISQSFTQIGPNCTNPLTYYSGFKTGKAALVTDCLFTLKKCVANDIKMNVTSFMLRSDVYLALKAKYTAKPWIIPCNVLTYARFSGQDFLGLHMKMIFIVH